MRQSCCDRRPWGWQLVSPRIRVDVAEAVKHHKFIMSHLGAAMLALCSLPVYLAIFGQPAPAEAFTFFWFISPLGIATYLSATGNYQRAQTVSTLNLAGLLFYGASLTGGLSSFLAPWLILLPFGAVFSGSVKTIRAATVMACCAAALLGLLHWAGLERSPLHDGGNLALLAAAAVLLAILYASGLAFAALKRQNNEQAALRAQQDEAHLLVDEAADLLTTHSRDGRVHHASAAALHLFGATGDELRGDGMFERVHPLDRPAFLTAISRAAQSTVPVSVEYRVRCGALSAAREPRFVWVESVCRRSRAVSNAGIAPNDIILVTRDIHARKTQDGLDLEQRLTAERKHTLLQHSLAQISQDMRSPIDALRDLAGQLRKERGGTAAGLPWRSYADQVHRNVAMLDGLVDDLTAFVKLENGSYELALEDIAVCDILCASIAEAEPAARSADVAIRQIVGDDLKSMIADPKALKCAMRKVIDTAVKRSGRGGTVEVTAAPAGASILVRGSGCGAARGCARGAGRDAPEFGVQTVALTAGIVGLHGGSVDIDGGHADATVVTMRFPMQPQLPRQQTDATARPPLVELRQSA